MGLMDSVGSALDSVSSALGGAKKGPGAGDEPLSFCKGENLGSGDQDTGGSYARGGGLGVANVGKVTEFIHFGYVHPDYSDKFGHDKLQDDVNQDLAQSTGAHAIMFRGALEREALLLNGFISACKSVLDECAGDKGAAGELMSAASDLLGGGGGKADTPTAADCGAFSQAVAAAAGKIKGDSVAYKDIHQAGIDLRQAYLNYRAFLKKLTQKPSGGGGGLLSGLPAVGGLLPGGMGDIVNIIQGIAFKTFDIYKNLFANIAMSQEPKVAAACRHISVKAIQGRFSPIFPVWFPKPESAKDNKGGGNDKPTGIGFVDDAYGKAKGVKEDAERDVKAVKDFIDGAPQKECPGDPFIDQAFGTQPPDPKDKEEPPKPQKAIADLIVSAFKNAIPADSLPGFLETIISEVSAMNAEFLREVYRVLMRSDPSQAIDKEALHGAARKRLLQKLINLLVSQVSVLNKIKNFSAGVQSVDVSPGKFMDRGEDYLSEKLAPAIDPILSIAIDNLGEKLEGARGKAHSAKAMTMEVYFGMFPWMLTLMFRDTFFPIWDLVVKETFGRLGGPLGGALSSADKFRKGSKGILDDVRDVTKKAEALKKASEQGLQVGTGGSNIDEYKKALGAKADRGESSDPSPFDGFPLDGRANSGQGVDIKLSEYDEVQRNEKWSQAGPPA